MMEDIDYLFGIGYHGLSTEDDPELERPDITPEILQPVVIPASNSDSGLFKDLKPSSDNSQKDWKQRLMLRSLSSEYMQRYSSFGDPDRQFMSASSDSCQNYSVRALPKIKSTNRMGGNSPLPSISPQLLSSNYGSEEKKFGRPLTPMDVKVDLWPAYSPEPLTSLSSGKKRLTSKNSPESSVLKHTEENPGNLEKNKEASEEKARPQTPPASQQQQQNRESHELQGGLIGYDELIAGLDQSMAHRLHRIESIHADRQLAIRHSRSEHYQSLLAEHQPVKIAFTTYQQVLDQWENATARIENVADGLCIIVVLPYLRLVRVEVRPVLTVQEKIQRIAMELWQVGTQYWQEGLKLANILQQPPTEQGKGDKREEKEEVGTWSSWASCLLSLPAITRDTNSAQDKDTDSSSSSRKKRSPTNNNTNPTAFNCENASNKPPMPSKRSKSRRSDGNDSDCDSMAGNVDDNHKNVNSKPVKLRSNKRSPPKRLSLSFIPVLDDHDNDHQNAENSSYISPQMSPVALQNPNKQKGFHSPKVIGQQQQQASPSRRQQKQTLGIGLQESVYFSQYDMTSPSSMIYSTGEQPASVASPPDEESAGYEKKTGSIRSNSRPHSQQQLLTPEEEIKVAEEDEYLDLDQHKQTHHAKSKKLKKKNSRPQPPPLPPNPAFTTSSSGRVSVRIEAYRTNRKYDPYANYENTQYFGDFEIQLDPQHHAAANVPGVLNAMVSNDSLAHRYNKTTGLLVVYVNQVQLTPDSEHVQKGNSDNNSPAVTPERRDNSVNQRTASFGSVFSASSFYASRSNVNSSPSPRSTPGMDGVTSSSGFKLPPLMPWTQSADSLNNNSNGCSNNSDTSKDEDNDNLASSNNKKNRARNALETSSPEMSPTYQQLPHLVAASASNKEVFEI